MDDPLLYFADILGVIAFFVLLLLPVQSIQRKILPWPEWTIIPVFAFYTVWTVVAAGIVGFTWSLM